MSVNEFVKLAGKLNKRKGDPLEREHENEFVKYVKKDKGIALKLQLLNQRGFPDRTCLKDGRVLFIEFKRGKNTLSANQEKWKTALEKIGCTVYVCYTAEEAIQRYEEFFNDL